MARPATPRPTPTHPHMTSSAAGIVGLAVVALRDTEKRRMVGVLWDVITFWPRANHPLTPPCYGERTVPELVGQLSYLALGSTRRLVLAAHSQGSIIAAATTCSMLSPDRGARGELLADASDRVPSPGRGQSILEMALIVGTLKPRLQGVGPRSDHHQQHSGAGSDNCVHNLSISRAMRACTRNS